MNIALWAIGKSATAEVPNIKVLNRKVPNHVSTKLYFDLYQEGLVGLQSLVKNEQGLFRQDFKRTRHNFGRQTYYWPSLYLSFPFISILLGWKQPTIKWNPWLLIFK